MIVIERFSGRAGAFHALEPPDDPDASAWWFDTEVDAIVLGSSQDESVVDARECRVQGIDVVRRRSGGGLVFVTTEGTLWLDVVLPAHHPLWDSDLVSSSFWLGELWIESLRALGVDGLVQHRDRLEHNALSDLLCFAGRGPGEVFTNDGSKVVGISQRRTRAWARFQSAVSLRWEPERFVGLLSRPVPEFEQVSAAGSSLDLDRQAVIHEMSERLAHRMSS